ncbi:MAG: RES family NAD+ phosphorylase [Herminiimonas sp.]|nr:RES family NAD+ phosphorylase [Herminiimonas sp.]
MQVFRIADGRHPLWDATGALRFGGRWNSPGLGVIYGATTYAGAMLEVLVHTRIGKVPKTHVWVVGTVPDSVAVERVTPSLLPAGWGNQESVAAREFGDRWVREGRSAVLLVPSVVTGDEGNVVINPAHPDAAKIAVSAPRAVIWDTRLFLPSQPN